MRPNPSCSPRSPTSCGVGTSSKLHGPTKWTYFYLYVIIDVFSRYVVGWMVATRESKVLARKLIAETCAKQGIKPGQLTLHADRGSSMRSKPVALLLADLGVTKTHSRPHVSNDNPYSESHFKTFKFRPDFPKRFGSLEHARGFCGDFFPWYNCEHHHSGLAMLTPHDVHHGLIDERLALRNAALRTAYELHPERFPNGPPEAKRPPDRVWINKPLIEPLIEPQEAVPTVPPASLNSVPTGLKLVDNFRSHQRPRRTNRVSAREGSPSPQRRREPSNSRSAPTNAATKRSNTGRAPLPSSRCPRSRYATLKKRDWAKCGTSSTRWNTKISSC